MSNLRVFSWLTFFVLCTFCLEAQQPTDPKIKTRPVSYGIVIDNSASYRLLLDRFVSFTHAVTQKNIDGDEVFLVTFVDRGRTKLRQEFTADKLEIGDAIDNMFVEGGFSAVLDAVRFSIDYLSANVKDSNGRSRSLLLITDGDDRTSSANIESVITAAKQNNIRIVVVGISDEKVNTKLLDKIAKGTGGTAFFPRTPRETLAVVDSVAAAIRGN